MPFLSVALADKKKSGHVASPPWVVDFCPGKQSQDEKDSSALKWSVGLEHESLMVHARNSSLTEYVVNVGTVAAQMSRYGRTFGLDRQDHEIAVYLDRTGVEFSGRDCAGIHEINFKAMAESVSQNHQQLTFDSAYCQISLLDTKFKEILDRSPNEEKISEELGPIMSPRAGMSSELGLYTRTGGKTFMCSSCGSCDLKDYTGSYHIAVSLPMDSNNVIAGSLTLTSGDPQYEWIEAHKNLANMFQWIEPLIVSVFGSADSKSVCDDHDYVEGSYRTASSGWGVPGTTDVRTFHERGTGRYVQDNFDWLVESVRKETGILGCVHEGMGSDIRTKMKGDDHDVDELPPMEPGYGLEFRIFDNFQIEHLPMAYKLVVLLAENSRLFVAPDYVYDSQIWAENMKSVSHEGWNTVLTEEYLELLETNLNVELSRDSMISFDVFKDLYRLMCFAHSDGFWTNLLLDDIGECDSFTNPNRLSWEIGAVNLGYDIASVKSLLDIESPGIHHASKIEVCSEDIQDFLYLIESSLEDVTYSEYGSIDSFSVVDVDDFVLPSCEM